MFASGKSASVASVPAVALDAQFNYVTMLLHGDGTNGAQNNTFVDGSTNNFTITRNGNTTQGSFSPYGSNWSNYFGGGSNLSLATATALGTGNVTVEFWFYPIDISITYFALYDGRTAAGTDTGFGIFQNGQTIEIFGNGLKVSTAASAFTGNTWTHFAVVRTSGTCQIYINGVASGSSASYSDNFTSTIRTIASNVTTANVYTGYISNLREVTSALYSGTFTPSTTPLTAVSGTTFLTCQSNRFIDNSANNYAITITAITTGTPSVQRFNPFGTSTAYSTSVIGGSGYFDGSGDYLSVSTGTALNLITGDFTIEGWVYPDGTISYLPIFSNGDFPTTAQVIVQIDSTDAPTLYMCNGTGFSVNLASSITINLNSWNHIAVTASGTTYTIWVNGVSGGSTTNGFTRIAPFTTSVVGRLYPSTDLYYAKGYITNVRVVKGTALYTTTFTPPTAPLTAVTNTQLLLNTTNGAIFDNAMMNDLETVGNAQISTSVVKYGTGSMAFDGTGDYLKSPQNQVLNFGTGNFTVEFWANISSGQNQEFIVDATSGGFGMSLYNGSVYYEAWGVANFIAVSYAGYYNAWTHIAVTRNNGTARMFFNGILVGSDNNTTDFPTSGGVNIGGSSARTRWLLGYLDDVRITKGYARYTANFTAPTAAFFNTGPY